MTKPPQPCKGCGGPKRRVRGARYCESCADELKPMFERQRYIRRLERANAERKAAGTQRKLSIYAPDGQKWCARCHQYLPIDEFGTSGTRSGQPKISSYCRPCASAYNHERILARQFGLTPEQYADLLEWQKGGCAICHNKPRRRRLAVDHDHKTGEIRGLLCTRCNHKLIGAAHESAEILRRAADYLDNPPAAQRLEESA